MNAIEQRVVDLQNRWEVFVQSDAKLLRWLADQREIRIIDGFIKLQAEEHDYHAGDLFFTFDDPFEDETQYATALIDAFKEDFETASKEATEAGQPLPQWMPDAQQDRAPVAWLAATWSFFAERFGDNFRFFVCYLRPEQIKTKKIEVYVKFIEALIEQLPDNVRVLLPDMVEQQFAKDLEPHTLVQSDTLDLDMDQAYAELAQTAGGKGPGFEFRNLMIAAMQTGEAGYSDAFVANVKRLLDLTSAQNWLQQTIVVHMMAGGVAMNGAMDAAKNNKDFSNVFAHYDSAVDVATILCEQGDPVGPVCLYQANMAKGTTYLLQEKADNAKAAETFAAAAEAAKQCGKTQQGLYLIEARRMQAYAYTEEKKIEAAWDALWLSHDAAELLPDGIKPADTTLTEVAKALLKLTQKPRRWIGRASPYANQQDKVRDVFNTLLEKEDWETA